MPCYRPLQAWQRVDGSVVFSERGDIHHQLQLACGQCIGCRLERSRQWATRCMHEARMHKSGCFVTLTYDQEHLPESGSLDYPEFQRFLKRLRKHFAPDRVRFYMCGEYGPALSRPHYHACLFGAQFNDRVFWSKQPSGADLYRSPTLERLWPFGFSSVGDITFQSAAYIARYCVQKVTGQFADQHYAGKVPEFNQASRRPGLGAGFLDKFYDDIYPHDYVVINGREAVPPRYYGRLVKRRDPELADEIRARRELRGSSQRSDNTPERLCVKEEVATARAAFLKRGLNDF